MREGGSGHNPRPTPPQAQFSDALGSRLLARKWQRLILLSRKEKTLKTVTDLNYLIT